LPASFITETTCIKTNLKVKNTQISKRATVMSAIAVLALMLLSQVFLVFSNPISSGSDTSRYLVQSLHTNENAFGYENGVTEYPWPQHDHDAQRTCYTQSPAPVTNHTLWKFSGDGKDYYCSFPTVADGKVFLAVQAPLPYDHMYALDAATGEQIWAWRPEGLPVGSGFSAAPAVDAGKIFFRTGTSLYCLSEATGEVMWQYDFGRPLYGISSVAFSGGKIYGFSNESVWCIEASYDTGYQPVLDWETFSGGNFTIDSGPGSGPIGSPCVGDGKVIGIGDHSGDVYCLNATTGDWMWTAHTGAGAVAQYTPTIYDGRVYFGDSNGNLYCWNATTGKEIWKYEFSWGICWSVAIAYDKLYVGSYDGWFRAFNPTTGAVIWEVNNTKANRPNPYFPVPTQGWGVWHGPPVVANNRIYVGAHDGYFYCWNATTGKEIWKYKVGGFVFGPAVADGRVYVDSYTLFTDQPGYGDVYCFGKGPTTTETSVIESTISEGSSVMIMGSVTDQSPAHLGESIAGVPIKLSYQTGNNWTSLATVTTDSSGKFTYEWPPSGEGTYEINASFAGDNNYEWSNSETAIRVVSAPPTYPEYRTSDIIIVVVVLVTLGVTLYNAWTISRLKKRA
jgi:outer membrane protein assembly factor BamB